METPIIAAVVGVMAIALLWFVLRRAVRMAIRLMLVGLVLLALLIGGVFWWWRGAGDNSTTPARGNRPGTTQGR